MSSVIQPFPWFFVLLAVVTHWAWRRRGESCRPFQVLAALITLFAATCTPVASYFAVGLLEWHYPPQLERAADVQAIVVLSRGANLPDDVRPETELDADSLYRCLHAARLYNQGDPCPVLVTGGVVDEDRPQLTVAVAMRDFLLTQAVREQDLIVEGHARNTVQNATYARRLLAARGIDRIALVTDASHMLRAERVFRKQGFEVFPAACQYRATAILRKPSVLVPDPRAAKEFQDAVHEWIGIAWYWVRGWI